MTPERKATLLFSAARRMARRNRQVSAYHLMKEGIRHAPAGHGDAQAGIWYSLRFQDAELIGTLLEALPDTERGAALANTISTRHAWGRPFDTGFAETLLSARGARPFEAVSGRLAYVLSSSLPQISGYTTRSQGMAEGLKGAGFDLVGLTRPGYPWDRGGEALGQSGRDEIHGISYHRIAEPLRTSRPQAAYVEAAADAYQLAITALRPEAVLAASNWESALPAGIAARRLGLPFFYEVRGFWEMTRASKEPGFETTPLYAAWAALEGVTARAADHVFTLNVPMREELIRRGVHRDRITLLPNGCDPAEFSPRPRDPALASALGIPEGVPVVGYVGSFVNYEGLEVLIDACSALAREGIDFRLMIVGSEIGGPGIYTTELRARAEAAGLTDKLIMPGRVPPDDVPRYYSLIDITPFPRTPHIVTETVSPLKPMEAMAMHKAVVVSDVRAMAEMVRHGETGLIVAKGSSESLASALRHLIASPALRKEMGDRGRAFVETERDWLRICKGARDVMLPLVVQSTADGRADALA